MKRILSIDVLRSITMFLMIFVNDVAGVSHIPKWIEHTPADFDGMGFSDLIFPAFLFIVGLSLPFAIQARINYGKSTLSIIWYIVLRALALIVMGFFHVNFGNYNQEAALFSYPVYKIIVTLGFFLIWLDYPSKLNTSVKNGLTLIGVLIVSLMAYLYTGKNGGLSPQWWGILGIIGWAYLFSALVYVATKGRLIWLIFSFIIFSLINITTHADLLKLKLLLIGDASSITLMLGGTLVASVYDQLRSKSLNRILWLFLTFVGVATILFGFIIRPFAGGISKIYATPAWVFICMGITILFYEVIIYVVDVRGKKDWFSFIKAAGTSTLTCYLIPYLLYSLFTIINFSYPNVLSTGAGGILRSLIFSFVVIKIVAHIEKWGLRLKV